MSSALNGAELDAPARLKKQLDSVLKLQEVIELLDSQIEETKHSISAVAGNAQAGIYLSTLCDRHTALVQSAETLYQSLNVHEAFPTLQGVTFQFLHTLLIARDLKILLRQRLVGRYFETSRLDQAMGGADALLGSCFSYLLTFLPF